MDIRGGSMLACASVRVLYVPKKEERRSGAAGHVECGIYGLAGSWKGQGHGHVGVCTEGRRGSAQRPHTDPWPLCPVCVAVCAYMRMALCTARLGTAHVRPRPPGEMEMEMDGARGN